MAFRPQFYYVVFADAPELPVPTTRADGTFTVPDRLVEGARTYVESVIGRKLPLEPRTGFPAFQLEDPAGDVFAGG